jgi:hypothetical protein
MKRCVPKCSNCPEIVKGKSPIEIAKSEVPIVSLVDGGSPPGPPETGPEDTLQRIELFRTARHLSDIYDRGRTAATRGHA